MTVLDPRLHAFREDLAAASLRDRVEAPRYADGELRQVAAPAAPVRTAPRFDAPLATEALSGEALTAYDVREGWAWVQLHEDGYVGYTPVDCLSALVEENTYRVSARLTYLYPAPDMKSPPITKLSFSCTVQPIGKLEGRFVELSRGGFIFADHLVGIRERAKDFVRVAERFVGVPYLWGGKTALGIDCSGLVQISLQAAGVACPRDSDMQMTRAGEPLNPKNLEAVQRGDLLFWKGHVAIALSADWMIHASGLHMEVVVEPLRRALERIAESHGPLLALLRPAVEPPAAAAPPKAAPAPQPGPRQSAPPATAPAPAEAPSQAPAPVQDQNQARTPAAPPPAENQPSERKIESAAQIVAEKIHASLSASTQERSERSGSPQKARENPAPPAEKPKPAGAK
jgi:cell wall-associated NlpC family hydrolase